MIEGIMPDMELPANLETIAAWASETQPLRLEELRSRADRVRRTHVGDAVHLRGLVEISNHCTAHCTYCGLRAERTGLTRYRMPPEDVLAVARQARELGYGSIVLKAGDDPGLTREGVADLVRRIKQETGLAVTLSLGERAPEDLEAWRTAGADRYLLRFETSNPVLYRVFHPRGPGRVDKRFQRLRRARELGYEVGSGVMVGLPGQTWHDLARDLLLFKVFDLDLIALGPWIRHPETPAVALEDRENAPERLADNSLAATLRVIALARLVCPDANLTTTSALATAEPGSTSEEGLRWGANVVMSNLTPLTWRAFYENYPGKACPTEVPARIDGGLRDRIAALGRTIGCGRGDSPSLERRRRNPPVPVA